MIIEYYRKFNALPNWDDLGGYIGGLQQNQGLLIEFYSAQDLAKNYLPSYNSLDVLIANLMKKSRLRS
jgi:hypothetical protein